ncbi:MAG: CcmD family protein [Acidithiobacillales bacterium]
MNPAVPAAPAPSQGALFYVMAVNLIIWAGLFLYLLYIDRKVRAARTTPPGEDRP